MDWTAWLGNGWLGTGDYDVAREVLQRGVAAVFLIAFLSAADQFPALLGEHGLLPVPRFLGYAYARRQPTIFRWHYSDRMLRLIAWAGVVVSASLVAGLPQLGPVWIAAPITTVLFLLLWLAYLSIVNVGQTFYGFGWESLLCEAGFTVAWLGAPGIGTPVTTLFLIRWLVFRLEFGAGMIKMRGGQEWRDLTALYYHHETQPMPGPFSRYAHLLPKWMHRGEVIGNHFAQLVCPFFLFAPQPIASIAAAVMILTQLWLIVTGNFAWLNWITVALLFSGISDPVVHAVIPAWGWPAGGAASEPLWYAVPVLAASAVLVYLSWWPARNLLARRQLMNASFNRWHLVNAYGAFGSVTKRRDEIVIEGTDDPSGAAGWREYEFHGKPGDPARVPRWFAPYHLRLDWLMWFLALGAEGGGWFDMLLVRLLQADRATLRLLRVDPFGGRAPRFVRARVFRYRFATHAEYRATGLTWIREDRGLLVPPVGARDR